MSLPPSLPPNATHPGSSSLSDEMRRLAAKFPGKQGLFAAKRLRAQEPEEDRVIISRGSSFVEADVVTSSPPEAFLWDFEDMLNQKVLNELDEVVRIAQTDVDSSAAAAAVAKLATNPFAASLNPSDRKKIYYSKSQGKLKREAKAMGMLPGPYSSEYLPDKTKALGFTKGSSWVRKALHQLLQDAEKEKIPEGSKTFAFVDQRLTKDYVVAVIKQGGITTYEKLKIEARQMGMGIWVYKDFLQQESQKRNFPSKSRDMHKQVQGLLEQAKAQGLPEGKETRRFVKAQLANWKLDGAAAASSSSSTDIFDDTISLSSSAWEMD